MIKVILDTNFLIYCAKQKIDYAEELMALVKGGYELAVPSEVILELEELKRKAKKFNDKQAAEVALKILRLNKVKVPGISAKNADECIKKAARGNIVATLDSELRKKLKAEKVIIIKGRKRLAFE